MSSNSSLVTCKILSPNNWGKRTHKIDTLTIHCTAGNCTARSLGNMFARKARKASSNYGIGYDGSVGLYVDESCTSMCSSNYNNDNRAITIEVSSSNKHPYVVSSIAYEKMIQLCVDICRRNPELKQLRWKDDKSLIGVTEKQNMTVHRWFAAKACPGEYLYSRMGQIANEVNRRLGNIANDQNGSVTGSFKVRVEVANLNIRSGPGTNYAKSATKAIPGVYTIVETKSGTGSKSGWGRLKSGAGWISLDYVKRL